MLDYEKLGVYRCAIEHLAFVFRSTHSVCSTSLLHLLVRTVGVLSKLCR
jgi:hypothetical protein